MLLVASLVLAACDNFQDPPAHTCRHLCGTCDKCTDKSCNDPECADKCKGHGTTDGGGTTGGNNTTDDEHECQSECEDCNGCLNTDCQEDACTTKCKGNHNQPAAPQITSAFNGVILHNGASGTVGKMELLPNGHGSLTLSDPTSSGFTGNFVNTAITYSITSSGVFTIWTAPDSNIKTPAVGKVEGRTVSVTVTNGLNDNATSYEFKSTLNKVTVKNMYGNNESNVFYYPTGYATDMSATLVGHTFNYALVNGVTKTASQLAAFTVPNEDVTIQYYWTVTATAGDYTIIYKPGEGTGTDYTDHADSNVYQVRSLYDMTSPSDDVEGEDPEYIMNFTPPQGKYFVGWLIEGTEKIVKNKAYIELTADETVLIAQWGSNFTVTLTGLGGGKITGVECNLANIGWQGSLATGFTHEYSPSSKFYLPSETAQWSSMPHVARGGFVLQGWQCSEHEGVVHQPGSEHVLTQDVTFTAVWQRDTGTSTFDGSYDATIALDLTQWSQDVYVRAVISGRTLTLYTVSNETYVVQNLTISGNTATGSTAFHNFTITLQGDTLTISVKRGGLATVLEGTFVRES